MFVWFRTGLAAVLFACVSISAFAADKTRIYRDGWLVGEGGRQ